MKPLRRLEKGIRRLILGSLSRSSTWPMDERLDEILPEDPRILLVRLDRLGDALISTPTFAILRNRYPGARIDILLGEKNAAVAPLLTDVDERVILRRVHLAGTVGALRRTRYDVVVNLHLNRSAGASLVSRLARGRFVVERPASQGFPSHVVCLTSRLLSPFGIVPIDDRQRDQSLLKITLPPESVERARTAQSILSCNNGPGRRVFLNLSASNESRTWPADRWGRLALGLDELGFQPVLCGAPGDEVLLALASVAANGSTSTLPPTPGYPDFAANLAMADIVVTTDGSTVHLAAALGKPTVALYSEGNTARAWGPWGVPNRAVASPRGLQALEPEQVISAIEDLARELPL